MTDRREEEETGLLKKRGGKETVFDLTLLHLLRELKGKSLLFPSTGKGGGKGKPKQELLFSRTGRQGGSSYYPHC